MRGADVQQDRLFSTVTPEGRVPDDHPLRPTREMVNTALKELAADFHALYPDMGRDSIPPEGIGPSGRLIFGLITMQAKVEGYL
jgi:hypothetical protein